MPKATFRPWVGERYGRGSQWGLSVLLLGESHYDEGFGQGDRLTEYVIRRHIRGDGRQYAFWTKIAHTFTDSPYETEASRDRFWQSVGFYNYVQEFAGTGPRQRPTPQQFARSWPAFNDVLGQLQPDVIVVLGFGLWDALCPMLPSRHNLEAAPLGRRVPSYAVIPAAAGIIGYIKHPSTGFRPADWRPWVSELMAVAQRRT